MINLDKPDFLKVASVLDVEGIMEQGNALLMGPEITQKRIDTLHRNVADIIGMIYANEKATLFNLDRELGILYAQEENEGNYVELGGGSVGTGIILGCLRESGVVGRMMNCGWRLRRKYGDFIDQLYLNNVDP